eukprot:TRINITY_DN171_c0_g1_i1.p1 TRINITY_DN171_c0_g1~~TRINITY_DN171_c0_g1_i1.p1  ORF type:complete len:397 (-),score=140.86 TRINITY_DN171_c0_g1_i1:54-1208(-)
MTDKDAAAAGNAAEEPRQKRKSGAAAAGTPVSKKTPAKAEKKTPAMPTPAKAEKKTPAKGEEKKKTPVKATPAKAENKTPAKEKKTPAKAEKKAAPKEEKKTPAKAEKKTPAKAAPAKEEKKEEPTRKRKAEAADASQPPAKKAKELAPELRVRIERFAAEATEASLRELFASFPILSLVMRTESNKKRYALAYFATAAAAAKAVAEFNGKQAAGGKLTVEMCKDASADVYIGGIAKDATVEWIKALFKGVATVKDVRISDPNMPRYRLRQLHFAHVTLDSPAACAKAAAALNGKTVDGHVLVVHTFQLDEHTGVVVRGLKNAATMSAKAVAELGFKDCGTITKVHSRANVLHVYFSTDAEAAKAVVAINGMEVDGAKLTVVQG